MKEKDEIKQLRNLGKSELFKKLQNEYQNLQKIKIETTLGKNKNIKKSRKTRRKIAQIWTILGEKVAENEKTE